MGKKFKLGKGGLGINNPFKSPGDALASPFPLGTSMFNYNGKGILESGVKKAGDFLGMSKPDPNEDETWKKAGQAQATRLSDAATGNGESIATNAMRDAQKRSLGNALVGIGAISGISPQLKNRLAKNQTATIGAQTQEMEGQIKLEEKAQNEALLAQHLAQMQGTQLTDQQTAMGSYNIGAQNRMGLATGVGSALVYGASKMKKRPAMGGASDVGSIYNDNTVP